jgi:hypothetical protein
MESSLMKEARTPKKKRRSLKKIITMMRTPLFAVLNSLKYLNQNLKVPSGNV